MTHSFKLDTDYADEKFLETFKALDLVLV